MRLCPNSVNEVFDLTDTREIFLQIFFEGRGFIIFKSFFRFLCDRIFKKAAAAVLKVEFSSVSSKGKYRSN